LLFIEMNTAKQFNLFEKQFPRSLECSGPDLPALLADLKTRGCTGHVPRSGHRCLTAKVDRQAVCGGCPGVYGSERGQGSLAARIAGRCYQLRTRRRPPVKRANQAAPQPARADTLLAASGRAVCGTWHSPPESPSQSNIQRPVPAEPAYELVAAVMTGAASRRTLAKIPPHCHDSLMGEYLCGSWVESERSPAQLTGRRTR
jgi:hypothetical protein